MFLLMLSHTCTTNETLKKRGSYRARIMVLPGCTCHGNCNYVLEGLAGASMGCEVSHCDYHDGAVVP